jgi:carboxyl-terminal processing protease
MLALVGCVVLTVGFIAGTRSEQIMNAVGPIIGLSPSSVTLNLSSVQRTYQQLSANFDGKLDKRALIDGANRGMVAASGDTYTVYFDAKEAEVFNKELSGDVGAGIGAEIGIRHDQPTVIRVLDDNPAAKAGLKAGDRIVSVNGASTDGWNAEETATAIRGESGTTVKLTVQRLDAKKDYVITRSTINNPSVHSQVKDGIGIMSISRFDSQTGALARKIAEKFVDQKVKGIIVDIRSDGGGYLDAATSVAGLWLNDTVVATQRKSGKVLDEQRTSDNAILKGTPTIVLTNEGSASASEILAAALREHNAATLLGTKTFGKGSVQEVINLERGAMLKVTVAKWYTDKGKNVNGEGLTPDIIVNISDKQINKGEDPQLERALKELR